MDSLHDITIRASADAVRAAWTTHDGLVAWWTARARVASQPGETHVFEFDGGAVRFHFRIDRLAADHIGWTGVAGDGMPSEWIGTTIDARITPLPDGRTRLRFAHGNWASADGAYAQCNTTWGELMCRLRDACEGKPRGPLFVG
jgi:uncharacterized protein YndB with AHSA1/START domain